MAMEEAGYWTAGLAAITACAAAWGFIRGHRALGFVLGAFCLLLLLFAWSSFIENCGGGGGCEDYANWPEGKSALVAGLPSLIAAGGTISVLRMRKRQ
jgi:hypothetical protein